VVYSHQTLQSILSGENEIIHTLNISNPMLWSPLTPHMYRIKTTIWFQGKIIDEYWTPLGIRTPRFDPNKGFMLNNHAMKLNGVCLHHDNGCLGAVEHRRAIRRKLEILKKIGCNAIRTSHNPPSQEFSNG
jgi:beta-galactosidase